MSGFLSKSKQKLEHGKLGLSLTEFKALGLVIGSEKTLLTSHLKAGADTKKAASALDEWAQMEGPDLGVSFTMLLDISCHPAQPCRHD